MKWNPQDKTIHNLLYLSFPLSKWYSIVRVKLTTSPKYLWIRNGIYFKYCWFNRSIQKLATKEIISKKVWFSSIFISIFLLSINVLVKLQNNNPDWVNNLLYLLISLYKCDLLNSAFIIKKNTILRRENPKGTNVKLIISSFVCWMTWTNLFSITYPKLDITPQYGNLWTASSKFFILSTIYT